MTRLDEYYADMDKVWNAIVVISSIVLAILIILVSHLIFGR